MTFVLAIFFCTAFGFSQEKPIRIGLKFGTPNLMSLNLEYATTAINSKLAGTLDLTSISIKATHKYKVNYLELGGNYYFNSFDGKGLYGGLSLSRASINIDYENNPLKYEYEDRISEEFNAEGYSTNIKIGGKWGNSFYFRTEIGYGLLLLAKAEKIETETTTNILIKENGLGSDTPIGGLLFNIGFGVAF